MKRRVIIGLSAALNVALAAAIFLSAKKTPPPGQVTTASQPMADTNSPPGPATDNPVPSGLPFRWNQIASEDLKIYRDNLRAIGCPELTVREIIRAVINERFGLRRRGILAYFRVLGKEKMLVLLNFRNRTVEIPSSVMERRPSPLIVRNPCPTGIGQEGINTAAHLRIEFRKCEARIHRVVG